MLKNIPKIISPELMKILMEMGHGDEIVIADGNYPCFGCSERVIRCDGHGILEILDAIMKFMPLDQYVKNPTILMEVLKDDPYEPKIWEKYKEIIGKYENDGAREIYTDKYEFYERAKKSYAVIATSESELYANIILKKGVVTE